MATDPTSPLYSGNSTTLPFTSVAPAGRPIPITYESPTEEVINSNLYHSADTDRDYRIGLFELTRVIQLYNTRFGTVRTGCYKVEDGTEDGFAPDPSRSGSTPVTLSKYHSADTNRDGRINLTELTRVIELFNYRSGTTRTGQYHVQAGTEDGFAPGPPDV